jgi:hypothetical protein
MSSSGELFGAQYLELRENGQALPETGNDPRGPRAQNECSLDPRCECQCISVATILKRVQGDVISGEDQACGLISRKETRRDFLSSCGRIYSRTFSVRSQSGASWRLVIIDNCKVLG